MRGDNRLIGSAGIGFLRAFVGGGVRWGGRTVVGVPGRGGEMCSMEKRR